MRPMSIIMSIPSDPSIPSPDVRKSNNVTKLRYCYIKVDQMQPSLVESEPLECLEAPLKQVMHVNLKAWNELLGNQCLDARMYSARGEGRDDTHYPFCGASVIQALCQHHLIY
jgi:hypothetical protein